MKFPRKMRLMLILKFTKKQGFTISLENTFFEKNPEANQIDPLPFLGLKLV